MLNSRSWSLSGPRQGRRLALTNLEKVIHPATGTTKGEIVHYYATTADVILRHLHNRPVSFLRYPDGPNGQLFFTKNPPPGTPSWIPTAAMARTEDKNARQVLVQDLPSLIWAANLVVEFHTHQWQADTPAVADRMVFDLDPGAPATIAECCAVALWLRERLAADGCTRTPRPRAPRGCMSSCRCSPPPPRRCRRTPRAWPSRARLRCRGWSCTG